MKRHKLRQNSILPSLLREPKIEKFHSSGFHDENAHRHTHTTYIMSALVDAAFGGAGATVGKELWRIENKVPVKQLAGTSPKDLHRSCHLASWPFIHPQLIWVEIVVIANLRLAVEGFADRVEIELAYRVFVKITARRDSF